MVQITGEIGEPPDRVLDLWHLDELRGIRLEDDVLVIGALTTYTEIRRSPVVREHLPALAEAAATIGAAQIQNRGTIGGNVANASPAGDTLPVLLATDAELVARLRARRTVCPRRRLLDRVPRDRAAPDELRPSDPRPTPARPARPLPQGRDAAGAGDLKGGDGALLARRRRASGATSGVALGSVAATPIRATETEARARGRRPGQTTADHAAATLARELKPIDDVRSTADYRRAVSCPRAASAAP